MDKPQIDDTQSLYLDACLTGLGAVWRDRFYATQAPQIPDFRILIVHLEMINIVVALRAWTQF